MLGTGTAATTLIITGGLYISDGIKNAFEFGAVITPPYGLYDNITPVPEYVAATGSRAFAPGEIANLYQAVDPSTGLRSQSSEPFLVPLDKEADYFRTSKVVTIKGNFNDKPFERVYSIPDTQAKKLVEIANVINSTRQALNISILGLSRLSTTAVVEARNIRIRRR